MVRAAEEVFMKKIKHKSSPVDETVDIKDALGEKVIAKNGKEIGSVKTVYVHPKNMTVEGIEVKKKLNLFLKEYEYIGKSYIERISDRGVMLKIVPVTEYIGMPVIDAKGKKIGHVKAVKRSKRTNNLTSIVVRSGCKDPTSLVTDKTPVKETTVPKRHIGEIGRKIVLKKVIK